MTAADQAAAAEEELPAWSLPAEATAGIGLSPSWPHAVTRDWAWGGSTGEGIRVAVVDSGIERGHPRVGEVGEAVAISMKDGVPHFEPDEEGDLCGHGTACAGVIRSLAPDIELHSARVLGAGFKGSGRALMAGIEWAVERRFQVVNLSLSTTRKDFAAILHEIADNAYFSRTVLVASAHNVPLESYPWRFSSVISVGSHEGSDPFEFYANPSPPVEFFARGLEVDVAWLGGGTMRATGNSFATPHISALVALILAKHPGLTPFELKSILYLTASNMGVAA